MRSAVRPTWTSACSLRRCRCCSRRPARPRPGRRPVCGSLLPPALRCARSSTGRARRPRRPSAAAGRPRPSSARPHPAAWTTAVAATGTAPTQPRAVDAALATLDALDERRAARLAPTWSCSADRAALRQHLAERRQVGLAVPHQRGVDPGHVRRPDVDAAVGDLQAQRVGEVLDAGLGRRCRTPDPAPAAYAASDDTIST